MQRPGRAPRVTTRWATLGFAFSVTAACAVPREDGPAIRDAWARPTAAGADGALYFTLRNASRDTLAVVGVGADVAARTSLHESMRTGEGAAAMVHMTPVARLAVPPGDSVRFAPLGRHAMLERLQRPLVLGDSVPFRLMVMRGGHVDTLRATAAVRAF